MENREPLSRHPCHGALKGVEIFLTLRLHSSSFLGVPFWGSYIESYRAIPKRNYYGASGYLQLP